MDIEQLLTMWKEDCVIDDNKLDQESIRCAILHGKYIEIYTVARLQLKKIEFEKSKLDLDLYLYYSGKLTKDQMDKLKLPYDPFNGLSKPMKSELPRWIDADEHMFKMKLKLETAKVFFDNVKEILDNIKWRHQTIKNILAHKQFVAGG
jgi:hypothetical protein